VALCCEGLLSDMLQPGRAFICSTMIGVHHTSCGNHPHDVHALTSSTDMRMRSRKASRQPMRSLTGRSQLCSPHTPPRSICTTMWAHSGDTFSCQISLGFVVDLKLLFSDGHMRGRAVSEIKISHQIQHSYSGEIKGISHTAKE
jgi:hypothetical protein